jgi:hypothetical protein
MRKLLSTPEDVLKDLLILLEIPDESWRCFCVEQDIVNTDDYQLLYEDELE